MQAILAGHARTRNMHRNWSGTVVHHCRRCYSRMVSSKESYCNGARRHGKQHGWSDLPYSFPQAGAAHWVWMDVARNGLHRAHHMRPQFWYVRPLNCQICESNITHSPRETTHPPSAPTQDYRHHRVSRVAFHTVRSRILCRGYGALHPILLRDFLHNINLSLDLFPPLVVHATYSIRWICCWKDFASDIGRSIWELTDSRDYDGYLCSAGILLDCRERQLSG